ncbi:hypothetical protein EPK99_06645 [Neorhizobium lilium]|uniref:Uncharacterized protein n=1 Tax=Neorhizobium lilium TaxID=2503024 RepID=A0A444LGY3_9HYPH|nr:hypothetical protein [Neorhizobium lilium]RWX78302.1 hypothetical protein EPK99_06645 [Neorhizobium lilium]
MRNCCAANQFDGSCEGGECRSAARPIIDLLDRAPVFMPRVRDYLAVIAFISIIAVVFGAITELRQTEQQFQLQARV